MSRYYNPITPEATLRAKKSGTVLRNSAEKIRKSTKRNLLSSSAVLDKLAIHHLVSFSQSVDLLVDLSSVEESLLSSPEYNQRVKSRKMPEV